MAVARRTMLAAGVAGAFAVPGTASAVPPASGPYTPAGDLGLAPANTAAANRAALVAALSNSSAGVWFPPGDYLIDNAQNVVIPSFGGEVAMAPGARLVFTVATGRGVEFRNGSGARFYGLSTAFVTTPTTRVGAQECVMFDGTTDTRVEDVTIRGSAAAGLLFRRCVRPSVAGAHISGTMADGLHFANCQEAVADRITTVDTGDDGVAFLNYDYLPDLTGGVATNLSVTRSRSRGVSVIGQSGVTVRDAVIDTTTGPGLMCAFERKPDWTTRVPDNVVFERVRITDGGSWGAANSGVRIIGSARVAAARITVAGAGAHGVNVSGTAAVTLTDVEVAGVPLAGFVLQGGAPALDRITAERTGTLGLFATGCDRLDYGTVTVRDTSTNDTSHWAVHLQNVARVVGARLWVADTRSPAVGYVVRASGTQAGTLGTIAAQLTGLVIDNPSGLAYTRG